MGNTNTNTAKSKQIRRALDPNIQKHIRDQQTRHDETLRLLLLGAGESGKSTILKQILLLRGTGFDLQMRKSYQSRIAFNVLDGAHNVIKATSRLGHPLIDKKSVEHAAYVEEVHLTSDARAAQTKISPKLAEAILYLNHDAEFKATIEQENGKFHLEDSWVEFANRLENYPAWGGDQWLPDNQDILLSRVRTTGVVHQEFVYDNRTFEMIDVGGQRAERKKWFPLFKGISGIVFVTSMSEYNQTLFEEGTVNRLTESINLWRDNINRAQFDNATLVLFLNKIDLLQQKYYYDKIPLVNPLPGYFPDPPLAENEKDDKCINAVVWYHDLFLSQVMDERKSEVFVHVTSALDPNIMEKVIDSCSGYILQRSLAESGLIPLNDFDFLKSYTENVSN